MVNFATLLVDDTLVVNFCYISGQFLLHYWLADTLLVIDMLMVAAIAKYQVELAGNTCSGPDLHF